MGNYLEASTKADTHITYDAVRGLSEVNSIEMSTCICVHSSTIYSGAILEIIERLSIIEYIH